jgi:hypothetical protein
MNEGVDEFAVGVTYSFVRDILWENATTERFLLALGLSEGERLFEVPEMSIWLTGTVQCLPRGTEIPTPTPTLTPTPPPTSTPGPTRTPRPPEGFIDVEVLHYEGQRFPLEQFHEAKPDTCILEHLHATYRVHSLEGGSALDPEPFECGFGTILDVVVTRERITDAIWADYRNRLAESTD